MYFSGISGGETHLVERMRDAKEKLKEVGILEDGRGVDREIEEIIEKKRQEMSKEEKLMKDRMKELGTQISKRFKELATTGF